MIIGPVVNAIGTYSHFFLTPTLRKIFLIAPQKFSPQQIHLIFSQDLRTILNTLFAQIATFRFLMEPSLNMKESLTVNLTLINCSALVAVIVNNQL
jgi:hypothetical protein